MLFLVSFKTYLVQAAAIDYHIVSCLNFNDFLVENHLATF